MVPSPDESARVRRTLHLDVRRFADGLVLGIAGELDAAGCDAMRSVFDCVSQERLHWLVVDLTDMLFTDSTGLGVLVRAHKRAEASGTAFAIACPAGRIRDLFALTHLVEVLHVVGSVDEARAFCEEGGEDVPFERATVQRLPRKDQAH